MVTKPLAAIILGVSLWASLASAQQNPVPAAIDAYIDSYAATNNFSGVVLVEKSGKILFQKSYGFADREKHLPNTTASQFHVASMSMQFTAAAILRLVDQHALRLDDRVEQIIPNAGSAGTVTVRDLLTERSGLDDINQLPDYNEILQHHQTPASLFAKVSARPLLFEPGSKFLHEEHSAYNILALILEKKTGRPFADAVRHLVFQPLLLKSSFIDDDTPSHSNAVAKGYQPLGMRDLEPAPTIHWSAKAGNASVCTTAADEARWVRALFRGHALSPASQALVLDSAPRVGYGWFRGESKRFGAAAYYMNGRAPGFASFVLYLPREELTVVALSNIYSSATTDMGNDIASIVLHLPYTPFHPASQPLSPSQIAAATGVFQFGEDFYQKNAKLVLIAKDSELFLQWPSGGGASPLIPLGPDEFMDRAYWEPVRIERDSTGHATALIYDRFRGAAVAQP